MSKLSVQILKVLQSKGVEVDTVLIILLTTSPIEIYPKDSTHKKL